jgi:DNA-binding CsgD family transcriptional regulator
MDVPNRGRALKPRERGDGYQLPSDPLLDTSGPSYRGWGLSSEPGPLARPAYAYKLPASRFAKRSGLSLVPAVRQGVAIRRASHPRRDQSYCWHVRAGGGENFAAIMYQPKNFSDIAEPFADLSPREQQVITLVCDGLSNKAIAEKLGVAEGTVKMHLHSIYEQLGVRSRIELMIALADRSKLAPD